MFDSKNDEEEDPWLEMEAAAEELPDMPAETRPSRIIVVGDPDIAGALIQYTQQQQMLNMDFLLKAADWLGNDGDIVGIRNRTSGSGRLDRITNENKRAGMMKFAQTLNIFIVPVIIVGFGVYRMVKRNRKKEQDHGL